MLEHTLEDITGVPQHILKDGLHRKRPCVAQIISWAAKRTTTRVGDKAYSLMGLLGVNMPMLYGEGKTVFHHLQLEIIHTSNDQSIFAWGHNKTLLHTGSVLASDLSCFEGCSHLELLDYKKFIKSLDECFPGKELPLIREDRFGVFPITNHGIQIWMPLCHYRDPDTIFKAYLPCRDQGRLVVTIDLAFWDFNYYRHSLTVDEFPARGSLEF